MGETHGEKRDKIPALKGLNNESLQETMQNFT